MRYLLAMFLYMPSFAIGCSIIGGFPHPDNLLSQFDFKFEVLEEIHLVTVSIDSDEYVEIRILESFKSSNDLPNTISYNNQGGEACAHEFYSEGEHIIFAGFWYDEIDIFVGHAMANTNPNFSPLLEKLRGNAP